MSNHNGNGHRARPADELKSVYEFVVRYKIEHDGNSPTLREIMADVGIPSKCTASRELGELVDSGYITRTPGEKRGIEVVGGQWTPPERV